MEPASSGSMLTHGWLQGRGTLPTQVILHVSLKFFELSSHNECGKDHAIHVTYSALCTIYGWDSKMS